jgi:cell wall-associated NlpC family hydrolase
LRVWNFILAGTAMLGLTAAPAALASGGGAGIAAATNGQTRATRHHSHRAHRSRHSLKQSSPQSAPASSGGRAGTTGASGGAALDTGAGTASTPAHPTVPGTVAKIVHGVAYAPAQAPLAVQEAIWAGNQIDHKPYVWGGGHGSFDDSGYDCSGSVSYVLHAAGLLRTPYDSSDFESWAESGLGQWITVYTNPDHAFVEIAGIRFDTSAEGDPHPTGESGPRWRPLLADTSGFMARHPEGY